MASVNPAPEPRKRQPWIGNLFGAINWDGPAAAAPAAKPAEEAPAEEPPAKAKPAAVIPAKPKPKPPFQPVTVHVHNEIAKAKPAKAKPAAEDADEKEGE